MPSPASPKAQADSNPQATGEAKQQRLKLGISVFFFSSRFKADPPMLCDLVVYDSPGTCWYWYKAAETGKYRKFEQKEGFA
jgi:hypothetical protein